MGKIKVHFYNARAGKLADKVVGIASVFSHVENVYYKCPSDQHYANNVVTITISSQSITFNDNQRGIDNDAFFTITYFTD